MQQPRLIVPQTNCYECTFCSIPLAHHWALLIIAVGGISRSTKARTYHLCCIVVVIASVKGSCCCCMSVCEACNIRLHYKWKSGYYKWPIIIYNLARDSFACLAWPPPPTHSNQNTEQCKDDCQGTQTQWANCCATTCYSCVWVSLNIKCKQITFAPRSQTLIIIECNEMRWMAWLHGGCEYCKGRQWCK